MTRTPARAMAVNEITIAEALERFSCPAGKTYHIDLIRPFAAFSINAYSTATTLPIGIAYIAALAEKAGYAVNLIDGVGEDITRVRASPCGQFLYQGLSAQEIVDRTSKSVMVIGVTMMFSQNWLQYRDLVPALRAAHPDAVIVVGGEHATALPEYTLRNCPEIDYVVMGEGELVFLEIAHVIVTSNSAHGVNGVCYIDDEGRYISNGLARRMRDFRNLPWPAWHLCPVESYFSGMWSMGISYGRNMIILATRGCPYQCTFCSNPKMWTTRYLMREPSDVVDEIEYLIEKYGCNSVDFADLTAIVKKEWILEFCDELERRGLDIVWQLPSGTRSEALDEETVDRLYKAGCKFLVFAPESGSRETLEKIKKKVKPENMRRSITHAVEVGHNVKLCMIIGFPHESRKHIYQTIWYAITMAWHGVNDCNISPFCPYPGSELFEDLREEKVIGELDDSYFKSLLGQFDFTNTINYCKNVPGWEIAIYRFIGMSAFYALSYIFHPRRFVRLFSSIYSGNFHSGSLFEQRIYDFIGRKRLKNQ